MIKQIAIVPFILSVLFFDRPVIAQEASQSEEKTKCLEVSREQFSNTEIYTPYQARLALKSKVEYTKDALDNPLKMLSDLYQYTQEEWQRVTEMVNNPGNPLFLDTLNPAIVEQMLSDDVAGAYAEITCSERLNPVYLPSDNKDETPLLSGLESSNFDMNQSVSIENNQSNVTIPSQSVQTQPSEKKQLGKKSYNLNPDNFIYEENQ